MKSRLTATGLPALPYPTHPQPTIHHTSNRKIPKTMAGCVREEPTTVQRTMHYPILSHPQLTIHHTSNNGIPQAKAGCVSEEPTHCQGTDRTTLCSYATPTLITYPPYL